MQQAQNRVPDWPRQGRGRIRTQRIPHASLQEGQGRTPHANPLRPRGLEPPACDFGNRRFIDELSNRLAGRISIPSIEDRIPKQVTIPTGFQSPMEASEEDEVRNIRRSRQISGVRETRTASLHYQQQPTATQATLAETDEWRPIAAAVRDELIAASLAGETLERAVTIALHFCRECCVTSPDGARSLVQSVLENLGWDERQGEGFGLSEFAYSLAAETECYW